MSVPTVCMYHEVLWIESGEEMTEELGGSQSDPGVRVEQQRLHLLCECVCV